jgi:membrane-associated phospholipid phosphatase
MCFATVYIQAHYAVDVIGGWISALVIYTVLFFLSKKFV